MHRIEEVHTAEVLGTLQVLGQPGDRDGRGVGRQDGVVAHLLLDLAEHRALDLGVLDHRLDHQVDVVEVAVGQRRTNVGELLGHAFDGQLAAGGLLAKQLACLLEAELDGVFLDVLHQDRGALGGALVGDTAAHDAGTKHRRLAHRLRLAGVLAALLLDHLIVEEQPDQVVADVGLGHLAEGLGLDRLGPRTTFTGALLDHLDGFHRCRIVRPGLAGDISLGGLEHHHLLDRIEIERAVLLFPPRLEVEFAGVGSRQYVERRCLEVVGGHHRIHGADLEAGVSTVLGAAGNPLDGVVGADQPGQAHAAAPAGDDTELGLGQADLGVRRHHTEVGGQHHLTAATEGQAVDRADSGEGKVLETIEDTVDLLEHALDLRLVLAEHGVKLGDVGTDDKGVLGTFQHQALDAALAAYRVQRFAQLLDHRARELVDRFILQVEGQGGDIVAIASHRNGVALIDHPRISTEVMPCHPERARQAMGQAAFIRPFDFASLVQRFTSVNPYQYLRGLARR